MKAGWLSEDYIRTRQSHLTKEIKRLEAEKELTHDEQIERGYRRDLVAITNLQLETLEHKTI